MKFTIVITTYNRLALLKRAIATSLNQTFACEVVVVDDYSTDGTSDYLMALAEEMKSKGDFRFIYTRNPNNLGHSQSVNVGVNLATGDWIKSLDDDDYLADNCLAVMAGAIALRPQAVICSCQAAQVDENESQLSVTKRVGPGLACYIPQADIHRGMLLEELPFGTPVQVAFRRDAFLKSGGWDSTLDANFDDIDSWIRITQFGDAIFINRCLVYRTVWPGSYNQKFSFQKRLQTHIIIKQKIYAIVAKDNRDLTPSLASIEGYLKLHWSLVALKNKQWLTALKIAGFALFSVGAWRLILLRLQYKNKEHNLSLGENLAFPEPLVRQFVLIGENSLTVES